MYLGLWPTGWEPKFAHFQNSAIMPDIRLPFGMPPNHQPNIDTPLWGTTGWFDYCNQKLVVLQIDEAKADY